MANTNYNPVPTRSESQNSEIFRWLVENPMKKLSPSQAKDMFGTFKLSTRLGEIHNDTGFKAEREWVITTNAKGKRVSFKRYWFTQDQASEAKLLHFNQLEIHS